VPSGALDLAVHREEQEGKLLVGASLAENLDESGIFKFQGGQERRRTESQLDMSRNEESLILDTTMEDGKDILSQN
jgi:hypothetical protein